MYILRLETLESISFCLTYNYRKASFEIIVRIIYKYSKNLFDLFYYDNKFDLISNFILSNKLCFIILFSPLNI